MRDRRSKSDRIQESAVDLEELCNFDNEWTLWDGFQTLTRMSKPFFYRGYPEPRNPGMPRAKPQNWLRAT
jgi:hypothetical protein